jgi:hypothetical protein
MGASTSGRARLIHPLQRIGHLQSGLPGTSALAHSLFILPVLLTFLLLLCVPRLHASPLSGCAEHLIDGEVENSPTLFDSAPTEPFGANERLCYRVEDTSFFAMEYWPERFATRRTA